MDAEKQREIARKGGRAAHEKGTAHEFTADEARAAGRKGGERVSANREHMSRIGRLGGKMSAGRRATGGASTSPAAPSGSEQPGNPPSPATATEQLSHPGVDTDREGSDGLPQGL